jgi:hypothetical protein
MFPPLYKTESRDVSYYVAQHFGVMYGKLIQGSVEHIFSFVANLEYLTMK